MLAVNDGQLLLNSHAGLDRYYKAGYKEGDCTATILLAKKRELEISLEANESATESPSPLATPETPQTREMSEPDEIPEENDPEEM
jgi:hypothetical protein